jgi:hypothetical protein
MSVVDLDAWRAAGSGDVGRCACGSEWFELKRRPTDPTGIDHGAVCLRQDGSVRGYAGEPHCLDCGSPWMSGSV